MQTLKKIPDQLVILSLKEIWAENKIFIDSPRFLNQWWVNQGVELKLTCDRCSLLLPKNLVEIWGDCKVSGTWSFEYFSVFGMLRIL